MADCSDQVSEKELISMKGFEQSLPKQPTAPFQSDPGSPPSYEEAVQGQDKPSPLNYGGVYPPMPPSQQGLGSDNTSSHGQHFSGPHKDLSKGRETNDHPFQQSNVKQSEGPAVLQNFQKASSKPPKKLKFLLDICPRRMDEPEHVKISGITFLANGNIVITDKANLILKIYDDKKILLWQRKLDSEPCDVTQDPTGEIAVASPDEHRVSFFKSHNLSPVLNKVVTNPNSKCFGLTATDEYLFVIWQESNGSESIRIYNDQYSEIKKLSVAAERFLAVDPATQDLFYRVLNFGNDQIKCTYAFSDGKTKWKIKIQDPLLEGMALLKSGILVTSSSGLSFLDFRDHTFRSLLSPKHVSVLSVNRDRSKIAMVINEGYLTDDKNDVVRLFDIIY
ncbi:uncharacterized protein LOC134239271 [Saccostrea cucullata]|uniref:uncharacterized protein LOC134239271 n=1 Tax=Saccostrea cuccullata TaxID=36930 RepID=UPI002ED4A041